MTPPELSVVMSVYNGEKHLHEAVNSILNQTFTDFEFIITNDGSSDKPSEILESFADLRIRLIHQENIGLTKSLNRGLKCATGEYIARMDADDISAPDRFERQIRHFEQNPQIGLVGTQFLIIDDEGKEFEASKYPLENAKIKETLLKSNAFCHGAVMFRRGLLGIAGYYREQFTCAQDFDFWLRLSEHTNVANLDSVLYKLRRSIKSITRKKTSQQLNHHLLSLELAKERKQKGSDSLELINMDKIINELHNRYKIDYDEIKKFKASCYLAYSMESLKLKYTIEATKFWLKSFMLHPDKTKFKYLKEIILLG